MTRLALRPQPLGVFPLPAGYLVIPALDGLEAAQEQLLSGRLPEPLPPALAFYAHALAGELDAALAALDGDDSPEAQYNRFVLRSEPERYAELAAELGGEPRQLLELVAYTLGWAAAPPALETSDGELRAVLLSAWAAQALEQKRPDLAAAVLAESAEIARTHSPLLAAQLLSDLAGLRQQQGEVALATQHYREALRLLEGSGLHELRAQLFLQLGMLYHDGARGQRGPLLEAARCYQEALRVFTRQTAPELYALAQNNLALAYLAMPLTEASDQLRKAIAVQALRETLTVYSRESYPEQWASAQLNLANALQHLPSSHPQDNLVEAVQLYEDLLAARDPQRDPLGYARLLANQGNALAHLGIFDHARARLDEAATIFRNGGDREATLAVGELLETMARREADQKEQAVHGSLPAPAV